MMDLNSSERVLNNLNRVLLRIRLLHGLTHLLKSLVVWCVLAILIRGRMGWELVNIIAAASFAMFLLRDFPTRPRSLRTLERIRPDSDFRFTTFCECGVTLPQAESHAWESLRLQTADLLARPTPYLSIPGFAFSFRTFAATVCFTLIWSVYLPVPDKGTSRLPSLLRVKLPADPVRAGSDVRVQVFAEGRMSIPRLNVMPDQDGSPAGGEPAVLALQASVSGYYETKLPHVTRSLKLTAVADLPGGGRLASPEVRLIVTRPPILAFVSALVAPPSYTGLPAEEVRTVGDRLSVFPGTDISLRLESDLPLSSASSRFDGEKKGRVNTEWRGKSVEVNAEIYSPGNLDVSAVSENGIAGERPFVYEIDTIADRPPSVAWILPTETSLDAPVDGLIPMRWQVEDDFGLSDFRLQIAMPDGDRKYVPVAFLKDRRQIVSYLLEISSYLSYAGSEVEIKAEAADNDPVGGPKRAASSAVRVRAPTVMDMYRNLTQQGAEVSRVMERLSGESTKLLKKMTTAARTLKAEGKMAWQMEQELVSMAEAAQQAKREAEQALAELGKRTQSAARQSLLSRETLEKLSAIGSMMNNLMREDYVRAQRELQRALGSVRMDEKEKAMASSKFNFEQFVQQVDRTHRMLSRVSELLNQAEAQKGVQNLVDRAQKALAEKNAGELQALRKEAADLMPKLQELAKDPAFSELKKALASSAADLPKQFDQASRTMRDPAKSSTEEAKAAEEKLKKSLADLQTAMQKGGEKSETAEKQNAAEKINSLIDGLIFSLGEMQAGHEYFLAARSFRDPEQYSRRLQKAAALEPVLVHASADVAATAERLILFDPRPLQGLNRAIATLRALSEQDEDPSALASKLKLSYRYTASAALQLLEFSQDLQKQGGGQKGKASQDLADLLQQLIAAQNALNTRTQSGMQMGMFGENLEQLAFQQELIRRSMEAEAGRFSDLQEKLGRIDQLLQDMRKTEDELRKLGPTPDVQERQQKIANKLMELQHSLTEKEEKEEKFEAEPFFGKQSDTSSLRLDRPRINEKEFLRGLPPEYREAGKKYIRSLLEAEPQ